MNVTHYVDFYKMWEDALEAHFFEFDNIEDYSKYMEPDFNVEEMYRMFKEVSNIKDVDLNTNLECFEDWTKNGEIYFRWTIGEDDTSTEGGLVEGWGYEWCFTFDLEDTCFTHYEYINHS